MRWKAFRRRGDDRPHHVATRILRAEKVRDVPVDVELLLKRLDVRLERRPTPGWECALDSRVSPPVVWVNASMPVPRQRFAMAHALGHLLLGPEEGVLVRDAHFSAGEDRHERDVNDFTVGLLVPLWMLEPIVMSRKWTTAAIAELFHVSPGAMGMQLEKLL